MYIEHAVEWKDPILVGVGDQQGTWRHQGGDHGVVPSIGIDHEHAVAVTFDAAVNDVILQVGDAGYGNRNLDAIVDGSNPPRVGSSAASSGDSKPLPIDLAASLEIVQRADTVPSLDAGRCVASVVPPPHPFTIGTMVDAFDLAELNRVDRQANVAVPREPSPVVLVVGFVSEADPILFDATVTADIENRW